MRAWQHRSTTGAIAVTSRPAASERRDMNDAGVARRKRCGESLDLLRALGLSPAVVDRDRHLATRKLPHELLRAMAEYPAGDATLAVVVMNGSGPA